MRHGYFLHELKPNVLWKSQINYLKISMVVISVVGFASIVWHFSCQSCGNFSLVHMSQYCEACLVPSCTAQHPHGGKDERVSSFHAGRCLRRGHDAATSSPRASCCWARAWLSWSSRARHSSHAVTTRSARHIVTVTRTPPYCAHHISNAQNAPDVSRQKNISASRNLMIHLIHSYD